MAGHFRYLCQVPCKLLKGHTRVILEAGNAWEHIFEVWHGIAIWTIFVLLGKNGPIQSNLYYFVSQQKRGQFDNRSIKLDSCNSRHVRPFKKTTSVFLQQT